MKTNKSFAGTIGTIIILATLLLGIAVSQHARAENPPHEYTVVITKVPEYLFGSAKYATPISFEILGCEKAKIQSIKGNFRWKKDKMMSKPFSGERYGPGDGGKKDDGKGYLTYTCFVSSSFYDGVLCDRNFKDLHSAFELTVVFQPYYDNSYHDVVEVRSSPDGKAKNSPILFADERMVCVELPKEDGKDVVHDIPLKEMSQAIAGRRGGVKTITNFMKDGDLVPETEVELPLSGGLPPLSGFNFPGDDVVADASETGATFRAKTRLYDETDKESGRQSGYAYTIRVHGQQRGGYFYVSYGGRTVEPTPETVMNLSHKTGPFTATLFHGNYGSNVYSKTGGALNMKTAAAGATGVLWALAGGPWGMAFGTVSSLFGIYSAFDIGTVEHLDSADGGAVKQWSCTSMTTNKETHEALTLPRPSGRPQEQSVVHTGNCKAGDQWHLCLTLSSAVVAESKPPSGPHTGLTTTDSFSDIWFEASSEKDLHDMEVITR